MTSKTKEKPIRIRLPKDTGLDVLFKNFLEGYDYFSWINRAALLDLVVLQPDFCENMKSRIKSLFGDGPTLSSDHIMNTAKLEMHFAAYHSTESLLGLLFAFTIDPSAPWIWLTRYRFKEFNELIGRLARDGLSMFGKNEEAIAKSLFFRAEPNPQIDNSAKFTIDYIKGLAKEFQEFQGKAGYNSYKHGLRTLAPHDFRASVGPIKWEELTTTYLVLGEPVKWKGDFVSDVQIVFKAIDYERSKRIIITNTKLMHNLFEIKKALLRGQTQINAFLFEKEKAHDILGPSRIGNTMNTMTISPAPLDQNSK